MAPRRPRGSVHRPVNRDGQLRQILVFAEGEVTERDYLNGWRRETLGHVAIELSPVSGSAPLTLVEHAVAAKKEAERAERKQRGVAYDSVWCLFDVDDHPNLPEAQRLATEHGISLAITNPCIELWFLLHFRDQTAHIERKAAISAAKSETKCGKHLTAAAVTELVKRHPDARKRSIGLEERHRLNGTPMPANPSSSVWRLIDDVTAAKTT